MSATGVRRDKAALSSGCKSHPANAPAGSNRSTYGTIHNLINFTLRAWRTWYIDGDTDAQRKLVAMI